MSNSNDIAVLVIDMIEEFVRGKFGSERAKICAKNIDKLIGIARKKGWLIVFTRDVHTPIDFEFRVWGEHSLINDESSKLIFDPCSSDIVIEKMRYDAFFNTTLDTVLRNYQIRKLILSGISTDICVLHTAAGAFFRNYEIYVCRECTESIDESTKEYAIKYMERVYGAKTISLEDIERW